MGTTSGTWPARYSAIAAAISRFSTLEIRFFRYPKRYSSTLMWRATVARRVKAAAKSGA